jgi:hypothetical protein
VSLEVISPAKLLFTFVFPPQFGSLLLPLKLIAPFAKVVSLLPVPEQIF